MYQPNLQSVALAVLEILAIVVLRWGCEAPILEKGRPQGVGDGTVRKSVCDFLQALHSNFSSIFTRFKDIAAFVLQHATFSTTPLVSPKFPHVPLGVGEWPLAQKSEGVGLIDREISFQDFQPMWSCSRRTDRRTDGQADGRTTMQSQYRAMHQCIAR